MHIKIDVRERSRQGRQKALRIKMKWDPFWELFLSKIPLKIHSKIDREKTWKMKPKRSRNGAEIDAKTHQKSMPELVSEKIKKIMKIHVFLEG
jgi:hypothetical protein